MKLSVIILLLSLLDHHVPAAAFVSASAFSFEAATESCTTLRQESPSSPEAVEVIDKPSSSSGIISQSIDQYHLLWSQGVAIKALSTAVVSYLLASTSVATTIRVPTPVSKTWSHVVLPMMASSCCLLQLCINWFLASGCAGFNTYLGPIRPLFLGLLFQRSLSRKLTGWLMLSCWSLSLLPEALHLWNTRLSWMPRGAAVDFPHVVTVDFEIPSMGCVACIQTIQQSLVQAANKHRRQLALTNAQALLNTETKGGTAHLTFAVEDPASISHDVWLDAIHKVGFGDARVSSVSTRRSSSLSSS